MAAMREEIGECGSPRGSSTLPFEQVVSLCEDFTGEWEPSRRPSIPSYLVRAGEEARETLLLNLLVNEIQRRRLVGECPRAEEYIEQLPGYASLVRKVFLEATSAGSASGT